MNTPKDGGPAFPVRWDDMVDGNGWKGMTLRDWFAGIAMQGSACFINEHENHYAEALKNTASVCYDIADAMIAARERKGES